MRARREVTIVLVVLLVIATAVLIRARAALPPAPPPDTATTAPGGASGASLDPRWRSDALDGVIYARPVVARGLVIAATENNSLYGLDPADGRIVWGPTHVGAAVSIAELDRLGKPKGCGNIDPLGITGAPGVDEATGTVFAVAEVQPAPGQQPQHVFVAVDAANGRLRGDPFPIDPPGADPKVLQQRPALAVANGRVYVGFGGLAGDCGDYHGWLVAVPTAAPAGGAPTPTYYEVAPEPGNRGGAIWATAGPSIGPDGSVYVATGNSFEPPPDPAFDRGDAVIALTPDLHETGWFAPSTFRQDNDLDADLGSTSPLLLPNHLLFQIGKGNKGYLVATDRPGPNPLGGVGGEVASADVCSAYGGSAFRAPLIYAACTSGTHAVLLDTSAPTPSIRVTWKAQVAATGPPVVAGNVVWAGDPAHQTLWGLDATTGEVVAQRDNLGPLTRFATPTVVDQLIVIATGSSITALRLPET